MSKTIRQGGCIILHDAGVVLRRNAAGHWLFPKGHLEPGETAAEAAKREAAEETGLLVEIIRPVGDISFARDGKSYTVTYFVARTLAELPTWAEHCGRDAFLVPRDEVRQRLTFASNRDLWDKFYSAEEEHRQ